MFLCLLLTVFEASAYARFSENGLYYETKNGLTATLVDKWSVPEYDFLEVVVPDSVPYGGRKIPVTCIGQKAFQNTVLQKITLPNTLISIENSAFQNTKLSSVVLPESIEYIGGTAFANCINLTSITILSKIETLEYNCFAGCSNLTVVNLPDGLKTIEVGCFGGCVSLKSILIPESVENLGGFNNCDSLSTINIPKNLKSVLDGTFKYCKAITKIELPETVVSLGKSVFNGCDNLVEVKLSNKISRIEDNTFAYSPKLQSVNIPDSLKYIGEYAFAGCTALAVDIIFPNGFNEIHRCAFRKTPIKSLSLPETLTDIVGDEVFRECKELENVNLSNVINLGRSVFYKCEKITEIDLSNAEIIGDGAFGYCTSLNSITFGDKLKKVEESAFSQCINLQKVEISDLNNWCKVSFGNDCSNPVQYSKRLYLNGVELQSLTIPDGITQIGDYQFHGWTRFKKAYLPSSVTKIGKGAFKDCSNLNTVEFIGENSVDSIADWAFQNTSIKEFEFSSKLNFLGASFKGCTSLLSVELPVGLTSVGNSAFMDCTALSEVSLPNTITHLGNYSFKNCTSLDSIFVPKSLKYMGLEAFFGCKNISGVYIEDIESWSKIKIANMPTYNQGGGMSFITADTQSNPLIYAGNLYLNGDLITDLVIPSTVDRVSEFAFQGAKCLQSLTISEGVDTLGGKSFADCNNLKTIRLPKSLKRIEITTGLNRGGPFSGIGIDNSKVDVYIEDVEGWIKNSIAYCTYGGYSYEPFVDLYLNGELLSDIIVPETIDDLPSNAFYNLRSVKSVTLPSSLITMAGTQFQNNNSVKTLYMRGEFPPDFVKQSSFTTLEKIYVPSGCVDDYKASWDKFASIIYEAPIETMFNDEQTAESLKENKAAYSAVYNKSVTSVDLTNATLDSNVTLETLKEGDTNSNILYYMPSESNIAGDNIIKDGHADNIVITDKQTFGCSSTFTANNVSYNRIYGTKKATMYLPYALTEDQLVGLTVLKCKGLSADGSNVEFEKVTSTEANTPYLIYANNDDSQIGNIEEVTIEETPTHALMDGLQFIGTYEKLNLTSNDENVYYIFYNDSFCKVGKNVVVNPFRAYISVPVTAASRSYIPISIVDDEATAIKNIHKNDLENVRVFSIDGRLVRKSVSDSNATSGLSSGLYIVNGNKVVVE